MKTIVPKQRTVVKWGVGTFGEEVCRPELDRRLYSLLNSILVHPGGLRAGRGPGITSVLAWASLFLCCLALTNSSFMGGSILQNFWAQGLVEWSVPPFPAQDLCQDNVSYLLLGCLSPGSALGQWPILRPPSLWSSHPIYTRPLMPAAPFFFPWPLWHLPLSLNPFALDALLKAHSLIHSHTWNQPQRWHSSTERSALRITPEPLSGMEMGRFSNLVRTK